MSARPRIAVLAAGGTVAQHAGSDERVLDASGLTEQLPDDLRDRFRLDPVRWRRMRSDDLTLDAIVDLAGEVSARLDNGADGVVVLHGTDTIEEAAFGLDLLVGRRVVVTGAMRRHGAPGADGLANLAAAVEVAASEAAADAGVTVVFDGVVHAARFVEKVHKSSLAAFASSTAGPLGAVTEDTVRIAALPPPRPRLTVRRDRPAPTVPVLKAFLGAGGELVEHVHGLGCEGLVVEGFGGGHVPATMVPALERCAGDVPVVVTSRAAGGAVLAGPTYTEVGDCADLRRRGLTTAGALSSAKAQVLVGLVVMAQTDDLPSQLAAIQRLASS